MMTLEKIIRFRTIHNRFMQMLGIRVIKVEEGYARCSMEIQDDFFNPNNSVHGGAIFTLADCVSGYAAASYGMRCTTMDAVISYLKPALAKSKTLYGEAKEIKHGKTVSVYDVWVTDEHETLIAKCTFTFYNLGVPIPDEMPDEEEMRRRGEERIPGVHPGAITDHGTPLPLRNEKEPPRMDGSPA